jgi:hypothetical protein
MYMSSLDVDSLFTNIPLKETVKICSNLLFRDNSIIDGLSKAEFEQLLTIATTESFILFNGCYYRQIDGVAMGSPLGPTLANIFLSYHEQQWLDNCPTAFRPVYYKRYVDDIFVLLPSSDCLNSFKEYLNKQHPNMHFTSEEEENNELPFLDIFVKRTQTSFFTSVYRKPTFSGVYTHYSSFIPGVYKESLVSTLLYRGHRICASWEAFHKETANVRQLMIKNGYPEKILDKIITSFFNGICAGKSTSTDEKTPPLMVVLPYLGKHTNHLEKKLKNVFRKAVPDLQVRFVFRAATRLSNIFRFKDRIPKYLSSGVIYKYTCRGCNSTYIGETIRHAKRRYEEHMGRSALTGKSLGKPPQTAISDHARTCGTYPDEDDFVIIGREASELKLRIKESLFIRRDKPGLNLQGTSVPLQLFK